MQDVQERISTHEESIAEISGRGRLCIAAIAFVPI